MVTVFLFGAIRRAYGLFPCVVFDRLTVWQAANTTRSLVVIAIGCEITGLAIADCTVFSYRVFASKVPERCYA